MDKTINYNVGALTDYNRSMRVALQKAYNGSTVEDDYFLEKLEKTANQLGYKLVKQD